MVALPLSFSISITHIRALFVFAAVLVLVFVLTRLEPFIFRRFYVCLRFAVGFVHVTPNVNRAVDVTVLSYFLFCITALTLENECRDLCNDRPGIIATSCDKKKLPDTEIFINLQN